MDQEPKDRNLSWETFQQVDMRVGTVIAAEPFLKARKPAIKLEIDFGDLGVRKSSAQITDLYEPNQLIGKQVIAVVNFPPKQIANMMSECLVLGALRADQSVVLLQPEQSIQNGSRIA